MAITNKPRYKNDPRISAMTDLVDAYQRDDIKAYELTLQKNKETLSDPFIVENIDEVTRNMRTKAVLKLIAPFTRFSLAYVGQQLNISIPEVEDILGFAEINRGSLGGLLRRRQRTDGAERCVHEREANDSGAAKTFHESLYRR